MHELRLLIDIAILVSHELLLGKRLVLDWLLMIAIWSLIKWLRRISSSSDRHLRMVHNWSLLMNWYRLDKLRCSHCIVSWIHMAVIR